MLNLTGYARIDLRLTARGRDLRARGQPQSPALLRRGFRRVGRGGRPLLRSAAAAHPQPGFELPRRTGRTERGRAASSSNSPPRPGRGRAVVSTARRSSPPRRGQRLRRRAGSSETTSGRSFAQSSMKRTTRPASGRNRSGAREAADQDQRQPTPQTVPPNQPFAGLAAIDQQAQTRSGPRCAGRPAHRPAGCENPCRGRGTRPAPREAFRRRPRERGKKVAAAPRRGGSHPAPAAGSPARPAAPGRIGRPSVAAGRAPAAPAPPPRLPGGPPGRARSAGGSSRRRRAETGAARSRGSAGCFERCQRSTSSTVRFFAGSRPVTRTCSVIPRP